MAKEVELVPWKLHAQPREHGGVIDIDQLLIAEVDSPGRAHRALAPASQVRDGRVHARLLELGEQREVVPRLHSHRRHAEHDGGLLVLRVAEQQDARPAPVASFKGEAFDALGEPRRWTLLKVWSDL
jgi:hypothetical protein